MWSPVSIKQRIACVGGEGCFFFSSSSFSSSSFPEIPVSLAGKQFSGTGARWVAVLMDLAATNTREVDLPDR